jgi:hypothetical protein
MFSGGELDKLIAKRLTVVFAIVALVVVLAFFAGALLF